MLPRLEYRALVSEEAYKFIRANLVCISFAFLHAVYAHSTLAFGIWRAWVVAVVGSGSGYRRIGGSSCACMSNREHIPG